MTKVLFDSISADSFPSSGFDATAGYTHGRYPSSAPIQARFPNLPHVSIAVTSSGIGDCVDTELGNIEPENVPAWIDSKWNRRLPLPIVYCPASWITRVRSVLGGRRYILWAAHYGRGPHICGSGCGYPQADATQWIDKGPRGENVDQNLLGDAFWENLTGKGREAVATTGVSVPYLARRKDGAVAYIGATGAKIVLDTARLQVLEDLGVQYGPTPEDSDLYRSMDVGPWLMLVEQNGMST